MTKIKSESRMLFEYPEHQIKIEWNGSATYNIFTGDKNVNCFTDYSAKTMQEAQVIADEWLEEELKEINQNV
jgi:hypothetical protein